ncbi:MAG: pitrilysin family protein [Bacillota bacterium]|nr:pitrilysin family protein [Bacillota bacterium]
MYDLFKLNNELRVVVENIDYVNSVSVGLWVENGSRNEDIKNNGISHFIEHMFFKGTQKRNSKEIVECIENVGGQINAFTGKEATCFYIKTLDSHLELSLELLSDMLFNSKFDAEDIEKEKSIVISEINMTEDSPEDVLADLHSEAIYGKDSLSLPILGTEDTVNSFDRDQVKDYIQQHYIPRNSVISISGKFDMKNIGVLVEKYFGKWKNHDIHKTNYSSPLMFNNHLFKKKSIEQLHMSLGLTGVETGSKDFFPLLLVNNFLGGGAASVLFQKIREEKGLCYSIYSYMACHKNTGATCIYTALQPEYAVEAINTIEEEISLLVKKGISQERIQIGKEQLKGNYILGLESTSSRMFSNGKAVLFLNRINTPEYIIQEIDSINYDRIMDVIDKTLGKGIINSAYVGEALDIENIKKILSKENYAFTSHGKSTLV